MADDTATMESVAPPNLTQANQPIYGDPGEPQEPSTVVPAGAPNPAAAAPGPAKGGLWAGILSGALTGLAGAAQVRGRGGFGAGAAAGVENYEKQQQINLENQQRGQQIQFESARAAAETADALTRAKQEDRASKLTQAQIDQLNSNTQAYLQDHNISPNLTVAGSTPNEIHTAANGGLTTLAQQNDGKVPRAATFGSPVGVGENPDTHSIVVYHGNQQPGADKRGVVDDYLRATRGLPSTDTEWSTGFGKVAPGEDVPAQGLKSRDARSVGQDDQFVTAMQFRQVPTVPFKDGRVDTGAAASMQQTLQQQADNYSKLPNAKPDYAAALQKKADAFAGVTKDAVATAAQSDSQRIAATAPAEAAAAGSKTTAEQSAMEPFKQKERQFQAGLTLNTDAAKSANEQNQKYWADPQHGYLQANSNFNMVDHAIDQASDGNGLATSFIPAMEALGVSVAQGSHRVAPADSAAAGAPGGWAERFNAWVDKASQGKTSPQLVQEGHTLINDLRQLGLQQGSRDSRRWQRRAGRFRIHQMPA